MQPSQLFIDSPISSKKQCRSRVITGILSALLGAAALGVAFISKSHVLVLYPEPDYREYIPGFYGGTGVGLMVVGTITVIRNMRYPKDLELRKAREVYETDERDRLLRLRCWTYTGYTVTIPLYIGILVSGFISPTISRTLTVVIACYGVILVILRRIPQKAM